MKALLTILFLLPLFLAAQGLPIDTTTHRITFDQKTSKPGSRAALYSKAKEWIVLNSPNNTPALVLDDPAAGKIMAKMKEAFTVTTAQGIPQKVTLNYLLTMAITDNQVSYQVTNLEYQLGTYKTNAENFITDEALAKRADRREYFQAHKTETLKIVDKVKGSLNSF